MKNRTQLKPEERKNMALREIFKKRANGVSIEGDTIIVEEDSTIGNKVWGHIDYLVNKCKYRLNHSKSISTRPNPWYYRDYLNNKKHTESSVFNRKKNKRDNVFDTMSEKKPEGSGPAKKKVHPSKQHRK